RLSACRAWQRPGALDCRCPHRARDVRDRVDHVGLRRRLWPRDQAIGADRRGRAHRLGAWARFGRDPVNQPPYFLRWRSADLPVEQPTKYELGDQPQDREGLGLTMPPALLARADQVIE